MAKTGRYYINIDVNWYDEWGYSVSPEAALIWIIALGQAKRFNTPVLLLEQLERVTLKHFSSEKFSKFASELLQNHSSPISDDGIAVVLHGWEEWNSSEIAAENGIYGNHIRWHVNAGKEDLTCEHCVERQTANGVNLAITPSIGGDSPGDRYIAVHSITKHNKRAGVAPEIESDFDEMWEFYPRKEGRKDALNKYAAKRKEGISKGTLLTAAKNYGVQMRKEDRERTKILMGATFFGRTDRWEDFVDPMSEALAPALPKAQGLGVVTHSRRMQAMGDVNAYRDIGQDDLADELLADIEAGVYGD